MRGLQGRRHAGAAVDPPLPAGRIDARRVDDGTDGRDTAGWSSVAVVVEHPARRSRQGAKATRARLLPLCRRLQHLRADAACRRAGDVLDVPAPSRAAAAHGQPRQKRGRPSLEAELSRLQRHASSRTSPQGGGQEHGLPARKAAGPLPTGARALHQAHRQGPRPRSCAAGRTIAGWRRPGEPSRISTDGCGGRFAASCGANGSDRAPEPRG